MKNILVIIVLVSGIFQSGCVGNNSSALKNSAEIRKWRQNLLQTRAKTDEMFKTDPLSPMAGVGRLNIPAGKPVYVISGRDGVTMGDSVTDNAKLMVDSRDGSWSWKGLTVGVLVELNGKPANGNRIEDEMIFHFDRYTLQAYTAPDSLILIVFDSNRPELKHFRHLRYFPPNPDLVLNAKVERIEHPDKITMITSRNLEKSYYRYAILHFQAGGKSCRLIAYKMSLTGPYHDLLFIPFRDATSGKESYGAGRFLELKESPGPVMRLDFNLAFNPLCNYSPAYNCPIPPAENTLSVPIRAGEMAYPHEHSS